MWCKTNQVSITTLLQSSINHTTTVGPFSIANILNTKRIQVAQTTIWFSKTLIHYITIQYCRSPKTLGTQGFGNWSKRKFVSLYSTNLQVVNTASEVTQMQGQGTIENQYCFKQEKHCVTGMNYLNIQDGHHLLGFAVVSNDTVHCFRDEIQHQVQV